MKLWYGLAAAASLSLGTMVRADNAVVPAANANTNGTSGLNTLVRDSANPRTFQEVIGSSMLGAIPSGSSITGIAFREWVTSPAQGTWPAAAAVFTQYDIQLAACPNSPGAISTTFSDNIGPDAVTVRSGGLTFAAGSFDGTAVAPAVNNWGPTIVFASPYKYQGTDLSITVRHTGHNQTGTFPFMDCAAASATISCQTATGATATTGGAATPVIFRITYVTPEGATKSYTPAVYGGSAPQLDNGQSSLVYNQPLTWQSVIAASELGYLRPGSVLNGMTFRISTNALATFPTADDTCGSYSVELAPAANSPATMSSTFAANAGAGAVTVKSGAVTIPAGTFLGGANFPDRNPFGPGITFDTPYVYTGGDLCVTVRHTGFGPVSPQFMDSIATSTTGYGVKIKAMNALGATATTAASTISATVLRFETDDRVVGPSTNFTTAGGVGQVAQNQTTATPTTLQLVVGASQLSNIPLGSTIDGVAWRLQPGQPTWPAGGDAYFSNYDVTVSRSLFAPGSLDATVANNIASDAVLARTGPMVVPAGVAIGTANPNPFGWVIRFDKKYVYQGGDLLFTIRNAGSSRAFSFLDAINPTSPGAAIQERYFLGSSTSTTTTTNANVPITEVLFTPSVIVPNNEAYQQLGTGGNNGLVSQVAFTTQLAFPPSQLSSMPVGSTVNGIAWRVATFGTQTTWPDLSDAVFANYDVQVSTSVNPATSLSTTYNANIGSDVVLARSGPLTIPASAFPGGVAAPGVNQFSMYIPFDRPFTYTGGTLLVTVRTTGQTSGSNRFLDVLPASDPNYGTNGAGLVALGYTAVTGNPAGGMPVSRIAFTPPASTCYANCDGSTIPPILNVNDFICFQTKYAAGDPYANCDGSTIPPVLNVNDFICFQTKYAQGCP